MHLKNLTIRGFKSFASATTFTFEPGVTAIVGPNGSGKSNVVDALAWVMGEQGAKTLRGGKMEDVIFAGTSGRAPLGRAQVSLTIDNTDAALPIDYSEVTISRTLFRAGGSEYAINGSPCRLLDIQELLSDSGLGREMHVIVGQGQLDRILHATPEDRRGFIEEAAGILKHRRRRERTVRKLDAMQGNLQRVGDLTAELRRQLGPLGRQAAVARRAQTIQSEVRDAKARLLADDLVTLTSAVTTDAEQEAQQRARIAELESQLREGQQELSSLESVSAALAPAVTQARELWQSLTTTTERLNSLRALAEQRRSLLGSADPGTRTQDVERLERQAESAAQERDRVGAGLETLQTRLAESTAERTSAESAARAEQERVARAAQSAAERREALAVLSGKAAAARSRLSAAEEEIGRLDTALADSARRRQLAEAEFAHHEVELAGVEAGEEGLDERYEEAEQALDAVEQEQATLEAATREVESSLREEKARFQALKAASAPPDGTVQVQDNAGILGSLAEAVRIEPGLENAISVALGPYAQSLISADTDAAVAALAQLRSGRSGRVSFLIDRAPTPPRTQPGTAQNWPEGVRWASDVVSSRGPGGDTVLALLANWAIAEDAQAALATLDATPEITVATRDGEVYSRLHLRGGSAEGTSLLETQALLEASRAEQERLEQQLQALTFQRRGLESRLIQAREAQQAALELLHESDATLAAAAERLGALRSAARNAQAEHDRLATQRTAASTALDVAGREARELATRLSLAEADAATMSSDHAPRDEREEREARAREARAAEVEARLALRSAEEQHNSLSSRAAGLIRAAEAEKRAQQQAAVRAAQRAAEAQRARAVGAAARWLSGHAARAVIEAADELASLQSQAQETESGLQARRSANQDLSTELAQLTSAAHRDELALAQRRARIQALEDRIADELSLSGEQLINEFGPHLPVPEPSGEDADSGTDKWAALRQEVDESGAPVRADRPFVRVEQEKRLKRAERDLAALGRINPLALEEFAALEERHNFLNTQLEDLKKSRKDLLDIIKEVDARVEQVFTEAYHDTAAQFVRVFSRLFPGGEGRLVLTDPDNMLTTGIEVEARPAGKKIKRLSLLSGGERSLTAVALLVAIFKARPSPFYVMDEVEAALDDTNLSRLITIFEELRESSQLIVITHQKRTMGVADALYGVTMRGDGVSTVISQRLDSYHQESDGAGQ